MYRPNVCGVGYIGIGEYGKVSHLKAYSTWADMIRRCYSGEGKYPRYHHVSVSKDWHNFQKFARWFEDNSISGYQLDKDALGNGASYSESTCCFLPTSINCMLIGINTPSQGYCVEGSRFYSMRSLPIGYEYLGKRRIGSFKTKESAIDSYKSERKRIICYVAEDQFSKGFINRDVRDALFRKKILVHNIP